MTSIRNLYYKPNEKKEHWCKFVLFRSTLGSPPSFLCYLKFIFLCLSHIGCGLGFTVEVLSTGIK